jgi:transposase
MARYKNYSYEQSVFIPVNFDKQIIPGSFEHALNYIVDNELDLSVFETRYKNDETGAPAYDPAVMLKIVLYAYSRGITSSREIEKLCRENIIFIALSADTKPHFTTIAEFISSMREQITPLFRDILLYCEELELIDKTMFAIDGCKISSNASKEWSGTRRDYEKKIEKLENTIRYILDKHKTADQKETKEMQKDENKHIDNIREKLSKIKEFIKNNDDKHGPKGNVKKSNITDNESAKMPSSQGVIQGYNGVAIAEAKHQIIVHAEAFGQGPEKDLLKPLIQGAQENFKAIGEKENIFKKAKLIADTGYFTKDNIQLAAKEKIDAYIPDNKFRKRDPRFDSASRHNKPVDRTGAVKRRKYFAVNDFRYDERKKTLICPAGKAMFIKNSNYEYKGCKATAYMCRRNDARICPLKSKCVRNPNAEGRQVHIFYERKDNQLLQKMRDKIDTAYGKYIYSKRMQIIEPVFANIKNKGLRRFSFRGKTKVDIQWKLYAIVHNIGKIFRYSPGFA